MQKSRQSIISYTAELINIGRAVGEGWQSGLHTGQRFCSLLCILILSFFYDFVFFFMILFYFLLFFILMLFLVFVFLLCFLHVCFRRPNIFYFSLLEFRYINCNFGVMMMMVMIFYICEFI